MYTVNAKINNQLSLWLIIMFIIISIMIVVGGLTRLTDSGLSITEWQLLSGLLPPLNQKDWMLYFNLYKEIPEFKLQNFNMTLQEFKVIFWWEWAHRFLGRLIGLCYLIPLIYFSFKLKLSKILNLYFIFFLICFQGFIGWYMVSSGLVDAERFPANGLASVLIWQANICKTIVAYVPMINGKVHETVDFELDVATFPVAEV